jgi:hypothetical protein
MDIQPVGQGGSCLNIHIFVALKLPQDLQIISSINIYSNIYIYIYIYMGGPKLLIPWTWLSSNGLFYMLVSIMHYYVLWVRVSYCVILFIYLLLLLLLLICSDKNKSDTSGFRVVFLSNRLNYWVINRIVKYKSLIWLLNQNLTIRLIS